MSHDFFLFPKPPRSERSNRESTRIWKRGKSHEEHHRKKARYGRKKSGPFRFMAGKHHSKCRPEAEPIDSESKTAVSHFCVFLLLFAAGKSSETPILKGLDERRRHASKLPGRHFASSPSSLLRGDR
jgi:hypothetical protein